MSNNSDTDTDGTANLDDPPAVLTRDEVLSLLSGALVESARKARNGRVRNAGNEKVRQGWVQSLARLAGEHRKILEDRDDLADLRERVEAVENDRAGNPYRYK